MNVAARHRSRWWLLAFLFLACNCANDSREIVVPGATGARKGTETDSQIGKTADNRPKEDSGRRAVQTTSPSTSTAPATQTAVVTDPAVDPSTSTESDAPSRKSPLPSDGCIDGDDFTCKAEAALVVHTNSIRARSGLPPLTHHFKISYVARDWSVQQGGAISHNGFPYARAAVYQQRFPNEGVPAFNAENVAMFSGGADPEAVGKAFADQWEGSPSHLANILGPHGSIGVGIHCSGAGSGNGSGGSIFGGIFGGGGGVCTGTQIFSN